MSYGKISAFALASSLLLVTTNTQAVTPYQTPLFVSEAVPPLNMLVMGRDHKLYYEAYNDASDLNDDGVIDVGYKGYLSASNGGFDYYGYFNSYACYNYADGKFTPASKTTTKRCSGAWSGDYLNYLATSRMDALRKVLYGGYRETDTSTQTVLQAVYIPQDAHTWGKEYLSLAHDGYLISDYTPLSQPVSGYRHLFAVVSLTQDTGIPQLRTLTNTTYRIWNWVSKERPVAGDDCDGGSCTGRGPADGWSIVPAEVLSNVHVTIWKDNYKSPTTNAEMNTLFGTTYSNSNSLCTGTAPVMSNINSTNFTHSMTGNGCTQDDYHTLITATFTPQETGNYEFAVDGDDAVDVLVNGTLAASYYGAHGVANGARGSVGAIAMTSGVAYQISFRHEEAGGDASFKLYWKAPGAGTSTLTDKNIRVTTCPDNEDLRESNCVAYGNHYKPTGILHDYGASNKMYFGLLTGSYQNNMTGGVLRSALQSFAKEYKGSTGQFCSSGTNICDSSGNANGIVKTINSFKITDFRYGSYDYGCGWITNGPMTQDNHCYMWGNPIGEMMYETMRYFSGAASPTSQYNYGTGSKDESLGLSKIDDWVAPYSSTTNTRTQNYPSCSVPVMTVISDLNPSYDYKMPGSHWSNDISGTNNPASISGFSASTEADAIWTKEGGGQRMAFIGESNGVSDSAPTAKSVQNLSTVRGLSPEEPSKQGTYYSAAVAHFAASNKIGGDKNLLTYSIALASPLPTFKFPVGNNIVTIVPFAKSVSGSGIENNTNNFQPTDQIVDYYIETIANTDSSCSTSSPSTVKDCNPAINQGHPYAKFRINYEDVEQGADHDMDAIALYELMVNTSNQLVINVTSEYAAGGIDQHMGYVISGTTRDGIYLEVKDQGGADRAYKLDTPEGRWAGECAQSGANCPVLSTLSASRTFSPSSETGANVLESPLWYAAKYGSEGAVTKLNANGEPSNYFLVTNALKLKDQLNQAFSDIEQNNNAVTSPSVSRETGTSETGNDATYIYRTDFQVEHWTGDLVKQKKVGNNVTQVWSAGSLLSSSNRNVLMSDRANSPSLTAFSWANLDKQYGSVNLRNTLVLQGEASTQGEARVNFIKGSNNSFRSRNTLLGDIVNSSPVVARGAQYIASRASTLDGTLAQYTSFQNSLSSRTPIVYVGANDGMLHAFNANNGSEVFAFVPTAVIPELHYLTASDYGQESSASPHKYYVDGTPIISDVYFNNSWHTVLLGTLGAGGREVFAIDITDPAQPDLLWEFTNVDDGDLGYSVPRPAIARLHNGKWAALVPNGYGSDSGNPVLFVIDIETGAHIAKLTPEKDTGSSDNPDSGLSSVRTADFNSDGIVDYAYAGDLHGNLWRFDLLKTSSSTPFTATAAASDFKVSFGGKPLYVAKTTASVRQPITAAPALVRHPSGKGYMVLFGTGRYLELSDKADKSVQSLYGIWDNQTSGEATTTTQTLDRSNLQAQTMTSASLDGVEIRLVSESGISWHSDSNSAGKWGWNLDLVAGSSKLGERLIYNMVVYGQGLIISTVTPNQDPCKPGLTGFTYGLNPTTGGRTTYNVFDMNGDGKVDAGDTSNGDVVSGSETGAGGLSIYEGEQYFSEENSRDLNDGNEAKGRQSWRLIPAKQN